MINSDHQEKPVRSAKAVANFRLLGRVLDNNRSRQKPITATAPVAAHTGTDTTQEAANNPAGQVNITQKMAGVGTQTDIPQEGDAAAAAAVSVVPAAQVNPAVPAVDPTPQENPQTMVELHAMIKDLSRKVDRVTASRSRSRSSASRRSRASRRSSRRSTRSSSRRRRTRSRSRRSSSRRSSRDRSGRRRTRSRSRRASAHHTRSSSRRRYRSRSPRDIRRASDARSDADKAIAAQFPSMGSTTGKRISTRELTLQPYKHLPPDLKVMAGERRSRRDLTFPEYMCGILNMVLPTLDPVSDVHAMLKHASHVAQDAVTLPWPAVRQWARACFAHLEEGKVTWHDNEVFTNDRTRLSWIQGRQQAEHLRAPCVDFNADQCKEKKTHSAEGRTWVHACATCFYITSEEKSTHAAPACWKKTPAKSDDRRQDNKNKQFGKSKQRPKSDSRPKN